MCVPAENTFLSSSTEGSTPATVRPSNHGTIQSMKYKCRPYVLKNTEIKGLIMKEQTLFSSEQITYEFLQ
jgi:hypothetical protein